MNAQTQNVKKNKQSKVSSFFAAIVIPVALLVSVAVYYQILGSPANFEGGDNANNPLPGNYFGMVYKGGFIVPILMSLLLIVITFCVERFLTIAKAQGKENADTFLHKIQEFVGNSQVDSAIEACDKQRGSVANCIRAVLTKFKELETRNTLDKEQKVLKLQLEFSDSVGFELPALERNLSIIATIASIATLMGLLGTVIGMIRAFSALAHAGAPDSVALANGISEALINTALGIGTSALAIIFYNYFTSSIDKLTYSIEESGHSLVESFSNFYEGKKVAAHA